MLVQCKINSQFVSETNGYFSSMQYCVLMEFTTHRVVVAIPVIIHVEIAMAGCDVISKNVLCIKVPNMLDQPRNKQIPLYGANIIEGCGANLREKLC